MRGGFLRSTQTAADTFLLRLYTLLVGLSFGLGTVILTGGPQRFASPSFDGPKALTSVLPWFSPHTYWGLLFAAYGLALIGALGRWQAVHVLRFGVVVYMFLAVALTVSVFTNPIAALTGVVTYLVLAGFHAVVSEHIAHTGWN